MDDIQNLKNLSWYRIRTLFRNNSQGPLMVTVLQAIFKGAYLELFPDFDWQCKGGANLFFHPVNNRQFNDPLQASEDFKIDIILTSHSRAQVLGYHAALKVWMEDSENTSYYNLQEISRPQERNYSKIMKDLDDINDSGKICLDFKTPYTKKEYSGRDRRYIPKNRFIKDFERRFKRLFKKEVKYYPGNDNFRIDPYSWEYTELAKYKSCSGGEILINGYTGEFFIEGNYKNFLPFLILGSELHACNKISYGMGYYKLKQKDV